MELAATTHAIGEAAEWAEARAAGFGLDPDTVFSVRLCVEEAVTNVVVHGCDDPGEHVIALAAEAVDGGARFVIADDGREFDPVSADEPGREGHILVASIGGRGIRLMRKFSKAMRYERRDGRNRLELTF